MKLISPIEYAAKHGISTRRIQVLLRQDRIPGAFVVGKRWVIPDDAPLVTGPVGRPRKEPAEEEPA